MLDTAKIRELREAKGWSQEQAAKAAGFSGRAAWSNFETGSQVAITLATLARISGALGVSPRELLRDEVPKKSGKRKG